MAALAPPWVLLALVLASPRESSMRCDGGVVQVGDTKLDVLGKCGVAKLLDARREERGPHRLVVIVDQWTYDFGPTQFSMVVTMERGRVVAIERGNYGYAATRAPFVPRRARCDSAAIRVGDRKLDLLERCGEPASTDLWQEERVGARVDPAEGRVTSGGVVTLERWIYDFGPQRFAMLVTLEDGQVVAVERGGYGYAR